MSGLQSMLVPLETLPGWPAAPDPSVLQVLALLIGAPAIAALVIGGISFLASTREINRFGPAVNPNTTYGGVAGVENAGDEVPAGIEAKPDPDLEAGGTSARW